MQSHAFMKQGYHIYGPVGPITTNRSVLVGADEAAGCGAVARSGFQEAILVFEGDVFHAQPEAGGFKSVTALQINVKIVQIRPVQTKRATWRLAHSMGRLSIQFNYDLDRQAKE